jgi:predicted RNA-binding protein with PIN domain
VRLIVDAMNVIGTRPDGWWRDRHAAMVRLVDQLERLSAADGDDITVVFERKPHPPISSTVVDIAHAPRAQADAADDEIVRLILAAGDPHSIVVVTSDRWLADRARAAGAAVISADGFRARLDGRS